MFHVSHTYAIQDLMWKAEVKPRWRPAHCRGLCDYASPIVRISPSFIIPRSCLFLKTHTAEMYTQAEKLGPNHAFSMMICLCSLAILHHILGIFNATSIPSHVPSSVSGCPALISPPASGGNAHIPYYFQSFLL
jgi:hypothetical protein